MVGFWWGLYSSGFLIVSSHYLILPILGAPKSRQMVIAAMKLKDAYSLTNLDSIFKSRDTTLPTKVRLVKAMVFPVVMYGCMDVRVGL